MSEKGKNEQAVAGVEAEVNELARELAVARTAASRRQKTTVLVFAILCVIVTGYLGYIYSNLRPHADSLVDYATAQVTLNLDAYEAELTQLLTDRSSEFVDALDADIKRLPSRMDQLAEYLEDDLLPELEVKLKPQLQEFKDDLPELSQKLADDLTTQAPEVADELRDKLLDALPEIKDQILAMADKSLEGVEAQITGVVDEAVRSVVRQHKDDIKLLEGDALAVRLQQSFEEAAGTVLDEFSVKVEQSVKSVRTSLRTLVEKQKAGTLSEKEKLELRYVQLWKTYLQVRVREDAKLAE